MSPLDAYTDSWRGYARDAHPFYRAVYPSPDDHRLEVRYNLTMNRGVVINHTTSNLQGGCHAVDFTDEDRYAFMTHPATKKDNTT